MYKKRKSLLSITAVAICFGILLYALKFVTDGPYRSQIPGMPDFNSISRPIQEQIAAARKKAFFFTTAGNIGELGMVYHSCSDYDRGVKCYQLAVKKNSRQWIWNYYLGYLNLEQGQSNAAIENFKRVMEEDAKNYLALFYMGEALQELGSNDAAAKIFTTIINASTNEGDEKANKREYFFPLKTYAMFQLARLYIITGRADSAEITLKRIIEDQPAFGPGYRSLASIYNASGNVMAANKYSVRANDLLDYSPPVDHLIDNIALISRSDQYLLKQIENAVRTNNHRWALLLCNQALRYFPDNKILISNAVFENFRMNLDSKALAYLDKHFAYFSNDAKELMDVTDILYDRQHLPEALKYFAQVRKLMPKNSTLAVWLFERGKKDEAITMMNELIKQNPGDEKILSDEIHLLLELGEDDLANKYFATLKHDSPGSAETFRITGLMAEKKGNPDSARLAYESAYKIDPKDLIFTRALIEFYIRQKNWQQAISHFRSALDRSPNEPFLLEGIGRLLIACPDTALRNVPEGIEYSERAFLNAKSPYQTRLSAGKNLATIYLSLRDKKNATNYINKTVKLAEEGNQSEEYIAYFRGLTGK